MRAKIVNLDGQVAQVSESLRTARRTAGVVAVQATFEVPVASYASACITDAPDCELAQERASYQDLGAGSAKSGVTSTAYYLRGDLAGADMSARFTAASVAASAEGHGFYLLLD